MPTATKVLLVIEREAKRLRERLEKGEELDFDDVKVFLKALGVFAGDKEIQAAARKKHLIWVIALISFAEAMKAV